MKIRIFTLFALLLFIPPINASEKYIVSAEEWAVPRTAETLIAMPGLNQAIQVMQANTDSRLLIRFPGGDEGTLWLSELKSWLISLGVASTSIDSVPGAEPGQIELEVILATVPLNNN